jgi:ankyrin repeat protein
VNAPDTLSNPEAKELLKLCKLGKLFEVQDWITSGKSLSVPAELKTTPLRIALDTGFQSLIELLVRNEPSEDEKNRALRQAVAQQRLDFIEILVSHGAEVTSVPFIDVLRAWEPNIIRYFLDRGTNFITNSPFAVAFGERIRTALGAWRRCVEQHPQFASQLQEQADRALRHFCFKEDLKWVSLMMWVGANPRSIGLTLEDDEEEEEHLSALTAAAYAKNVEILKRLKPNGKTDDVSGLLEFAARFGHKEVIQYLFELGAKPNDKPNGGSTALDNALESFDYEIFRHRLSPLRYYSPKAPKYRVSDGRATIKLLLERGAHWRPDDANQITRVRRVLYQCEPDVTIELVELLMKYSAASRESIHNLLRTPVMNEHLASGVRRVVMLGFDIRTPKQKSEDERREEKYRQWAQAELATRYDRQKFYEEIWSEPIQHVAKRYNLSDVGLAKVCRKLDIPRPGRGYWAIKAAGKPLPTQPPLPPIINPE